jgi:hypothetical protein
MIWSISSESGSLTSHLLYFVNSFQDCVDIKGMGPLGRRIEEWVGCRVRALDLHGNERVRPPPESYTIVFPRPGSGDPSTVSAHDSALSGGSPDRGDTSSQTGCTHLTIDGDFNGIVREYRRTMECCAQPDVILHGHRSRPRRLRGATQQPMPPHPFGQDRGCRSTE